MTTATRPLGDSMALAPVRSALRSAFGTDRLPGLAPQLLVTDPVGWTPATTLIDGSRLSDLLTAAARSWGAAPHAAAALAWKAYSYWLALPTVLSWASARRVPLVYPADVLVHTADHRPLVTVGLRRTIRVAVLPTDPLALAAAPRRDSIPPDPGTGRDPITLHPGSGRDPVSLAAAPGPDSIPLSAGTRRDATSLSAGTRRTGGLPGETPAEHRDGIPAAGATGYGHRPAAPEIMVVPNEAALLGALRTSMLDAHVTPLLERIRDRVNLGSRTLLGSLAANVAYIVIRAADTLPGSTVANIGTLLDVLDIADLVDLVPGPDGALTVQRKTCCLAFTLPNPKICSGCCIRPN